MSDLTNDQTLPKTQANSRAVSCLNGLHHGGASSKLFVPGEDPALFDTLIDEAFALHQPATTADAALVTESVRALWILWRRQRANLHLESEIQTLRPDVTYWTAPDLHQLELLDRYQTAADRTLTRALSRLKTIRKDDSNQERWREHLAIQKQRIALESSKFEFAKVKDARVAAQKEAEARLAADRANSQLATIEHFRAQEKSARQVADQSQAANKPIQFSAQLGCFVIKQTVSLSCRENGDAFIDVLNPSHDTVREILENIDQYQDAPRFVVRKFVFSGFIPTRYRFLLDLGHKLPCEGQLTCEHTFDFESFLDLAIFESELLMTQDAEEAAEEFTPEPANPGESGS